MNMCDAYREQYGCNFISVMPTNLYGPNDNYDLTNSHVLPALLRKFYEARIDRSEVVVWAAESQKESFFMPMISLVAGYFLMENYNKAGLVNIGVGNDISITDLAYLIKDITRFEGDVQFDTSKPDGTPRKLLDVLKLTALGWKATINLEEGIKNIYEQAFLQTSVC